MKAMPSMSTVAPAPVVPTVTVPLEPCAPTARPDGAVIRTGRPVDSPNSIVSWKSFDFAVAAAPPYTVRSTETDAAGPVYRKVHGPDAGVEHDETAAAGSEANVFEIGAATSIVKDALAAAGVAVGLSVAAAGEVHAPSAAATTTSVAAKKTERTELDSGRNMATSCVAATRRWSPDRRVAPSDRPSGCPHNATRVCPIPARVATREHGPMPTRVLVIDDHDGFRREVRALLDASGALVVGEAADGASALDRAGAVLPDLVLLDIALPDTTGFDLLPKIRAAVPGAAILLVSSRPEREFGDRLGPAGADGFIDKATLARGVPPALARFLDR